MRVFTDMVMKSRILFYAFLFVIVVAFTVGCTTGGPTLPPLPTATVTPLPTATSTPTLTPVPTATPTPTATPIPPMEVSIPWPEQVSVLEPVTIAVDVVQPYDVRIPVGVRATVMDPEAGTYGTFDLRLQEGSRYVADAPLRLPFEPLPGYWWVIAHVETGLPVTGDRVLTFEPVPIDFRVLTDTLPAGVTLRVPEAFEEVTALGDPWAGGRVWRYDGGEVALWWAPGPTEDLLLNNAVVMLEATHDTEDPPAVANVEEGELQGRTAFFFEETWPGYEGGPAEAMVVQGDDFRLYVLRIRAVGSDAIPVLMRDVGETFAFVE